MSNKTQGFTLIELLISMAVFSILMLAFTQIFGSSLRASSSINSRNELISEGQIAQQLIASRLQSAAYLYSGTLQLTAGGATTKNSIRSGAEQNWRVGTDPFIAMLVPPEIAGVCNISNIKSCFTFYAYYPMVRKELVTNVSSSAPPADPNNENVWVLMEYRANIIDGVDRSNNQTKDPPLPGTTYGTAYMGGKGTMLVDYIQPVTEAPTYTMFSICQPAISTAAPCPIGTTASNPTQVDFDLRLLQNRSGKAMMAPSSTAPLSTHIYPRNLN